MITIHKRIINYAELTAGSKALVSLFSENQEGVHLYILLVPLKVASRINDYRNVLSDAITHGSTIHLLPFLLYFGGSIISDCQNKVYT